MTTNSATTIHSAPPGRIRLRSTVVVLAIGATLLAGCGQSGTSASGTSACGKSIAFLGALTGDYGALGQNMVDGVKVALSQYNKNHPNCQINLKTFDSQGSASSAPALATQIVSDDSILGLVGPGFSGESLATGKTFFDAGLPTISPSATNVTITQQGWSTWHRVIGNDTAQGVADSKYLRTTLKAKKVFVIDDSSDYGKGLADVVRSNLASVQVGTDEVQQKQTDFSASVTKVLASNADSVFYGGYYAEAGLLVKQLRQAHWTGVFMSGDGSEDPAFVKAAGSQAAEGAVLSAPAGPAPASFNTAFKAVNGADAGLYSTQAYDAANILLAAFAAGKVSHQDVNAYIGSYDAVGVTGPVSFDNKGDIKTSTIFAYVVKNGVLDTGHPTAIR